MSSTYKRITIAVCILLMANQLHAATRKVLFIGDSYIYMNNMPLMLQTLTTSLGDTLIYDESDPGGYTFEQHSTYAPTIAKIFSQKWDIVIMQEQSQRPAFPPSQVATEVYPYAHILDSLVRANDSCTQTMFLMTWGHAYGDPDNCPFYPVICTYDGMQQRLRESYLQMTQDNKAVVAPVGVAWKVMRDSFPALWLYQSDDTHPVISGSYLETCVLYNSIFHKRTLGATYTDGLAATDAQTIQRIADKVTLDSIAQWQQYGHYPDAAFTHANIGTKYTFAHLPLITESHTWSFGDGSNDIVSDPVHTYAAAGRYVVAHTAATDCFSETITDTITITAATTGVSSNTMSDFNEPVRISYGENNSISFILPQLHIYNELEVYNTNGQCIRHYKLTDHAVTDHFIPGFYIYHAYSSDKSRSFTGKLISY